jgi:acyl phosphate:glycerol-3-phosphate acyltransferase
MLTRYPPLLRSLGMDLSTALKTPMVLAAAYALGCFATGYYLVRLRTTRDIRQTGSGSIGATNVSRVLGWPGFVVTLILDAGKGALTVFLARQYELDSWAIWLAVLAVVAGHVWPVQLRFRGGKGAATYLGAVLTFDWRIGLVLVPLTLVGYLIARHPTLAGLVAVALLPAVLWMLGFPSEVNLGLAALASLILFAHRTNIRAGICQIRLDDGLGRE